MKKFLLILILFFSSSKLKDVSVMGLSLGMKTREVETVLGQSPVVRSDDPQLDIYYLDIMDHMTMLLLTYSNELLIQLSMQADCVDLPQAIALRTQWARKLQKELGRPRIIEGNDYYEHYIIWENKQNILYLGLDATIKTEGPTNYFLYSHYHRADLWTPFKNPDYHYNPGEK